MRKLTINNAQLKIIFLILLVIILGYAIYQHTNTSQSSLSSSSQPKLMSSTLTEDEKFILHPPPTDASASAKQKHAEIVAKLAKGADLLNLKECQPTPLVLQLKLGSEFKVKNDDNIEHTLTFDADHHFKLKASGLTTIKAEFKYGTGDYGYVCEGLGLVGFLHVTP